MDAKGAPAGTQTLQQPAGSEEQDVEAQLQQQQQYQTVMNEVEVALAFEFTTIGIVFIFLDYCLFIMCNNLPVVAWQIGVMCSG